MIGIGRRWALFALAVLGLGGRGAAGGADSGAYPSDRDLLKAPPGEWPSYGRDEAGTHYGPLDRINAAAGPHAARGALFVFGDHPPMPILGNGGMS